MSTGGMKDSTLAMVLGDLQMRAEWIYSEQEAGREQLDEAVSRTNK
jgi:hypothetical protein